MLYIRNEFLNLNLFNVVLVNSVYQKGMAEFLHGRLIRRIVRVTAIVISVLAGILFAIAIIIFQKPDNRLWSGDTAPSGEPDAFPLVVVSSQMKDIDYFFPVYILMTVSTDWILYYLG